jgi:hypothetical protein
VSDHAILFTINCCCSCLLIVVIVSMLIRTPYSNILVFFVLRLVKVDHVLVVSNLTIMSLSLNFCVLNTSGNISLHNFKKKKRRTSVSILVLKSTKSMFCLFLAYQTNYKYRRYHVGTLGAFNWKPLEGSDCEFGGGKEGLEGLEFLVP